MIGLLIKDYYVISNQLKLIIFIYFFGTLITGLSINAILIIFGAMMPLTTMGYDEKAGWDEFAAALPYSIKERVLSKFLLGYISIGLTALAACLEILFSFFAVPPDSPDLLSQIFFISSISLIYLAISLPLSIRFGVEQGRYHILMVSLTLVIFYSFITTFMFELLSFGTVLLFMWGVAILLNVISVKLSIIFLEKKF